METSVGVVRQQIDNQLRSHPSLAATLRQLRPRLQRKLGPLPASVTIGPAVLQTVLDGWVRLQPLLLSPYLVLSSAFRAVAAAQGETGRKAERVAYAQSTGGVQDDAVLRFARHVITQSMWGLRVEGNGIIALMVALGRYLLRKRAGRSPDDGGYRSPSEENLGAPCSHQPTSTPPQPVGSLPLICRRARHALARSLKPDALRTCHAKLRRYASARGPRSGVGGQL